MTKKSPFVSYTPEQIFAAENNAFVIQVGLDVFSIQEQWHFTRWSAHAYFNKVIHELKHELKHGNKKQRSEAVEMLGHVRIMPLRIH